MLGCERRMYKPLSAILTLIYFFSSLMQRTLIILSFVVGTIEPSKGQDIYAILENDKAATVDDHRHCESPNLLYAPYSSSLKAHAHCSIFHFLVEVLFFLILHSPFGSVLGQSCTISLNSLILGKRQSL